MISVSVDLVLFVWTIQPKELHNMFWNEMFEKSFGHYCPTDENKSCS
jgi:hypothetical protein